MKKEIGLYVHIPFCKSKCAYCDFASFAGREGDMERYVDQVMLEMDQRAGGDALIATLYIGGGTPSLLPPELMDKMLSHLRKRFSFLPNAEATCECNPGTVTEAFLKVLKRYGVNRLSLGAQASQGRLLSLLGRIHNWSQVEESVETARRCGFQNLNLDLMLGLPTQTLRDVQETLARALSLAPAHLSCYGLIVEDGTPMKDKVSRGVWTLPDEDLERDMYDCCVETLKANGFAQYEISNFSRPGYACRHNVDCWKRKEYLGLGSAACGFIGNKRYQNPPSLTDYLQGLPPEETVISREEAMFETMMLGLRMVQGVSLTAFEETYGEPLFKVYGEKLKKPLAQGLVERRDDFLRLTRRGMDVQNSVLVELL